MLTTEDLIDDLQVMVRADRGHLTLALRRGDRALAHQFVDSIIDNQRKIEDLREGRIRPEKV